MKRIHYGYLVIITVIIVACAIIFFNLNNKAYSHIQELVGQELQCKATKSFIVSTDLNNTDIKTTRGHMRGTLFHYSITGANLESGEYSKIYIYDKLYKHHLYVKRNVDGVVVFEGKNSDDNSNSSKIIEYNLDTNILTSITTRYNGKSHSFTLVKIIMECS